MALPMMPKATAVWLVENTALTFEQIADFCSMHLLEVSAIADGEVAAGILGLDPVANGQLMREEIERCTHDPKARLVLNAPREQQPAARRGARYIPVSKRADKPDAIAWLLHNDAELSDADISRLLGTTKTTINAVRERTHWNSANINPRDPVALGLCSQNDLNEVITRAAAKARPKEKSPPAASGTAGT